MLRLQKGGMAVTCVIAHKGGETYVIEEVGQPFDVTHLHLSINYYAKRSTSGSQVNAFLHNHRDRHQIINSEDTELLQEFIQLQQGETS